MEGATVVRSSPFLFRPYVVAAGRPTWRGSMSLVEEAVKAFESQRAGVIAEVENTPEDDLDYQISEDARSVRDIGLHIARAGVGFVDEILKADGSFMNLFSPDTQAGLEVK